MVFIWIVIGLIVLAFFSAWRASRGSEQQPPMPSEPAHPTPAYQGPSRSFIQSVVGESYDNPDGTSRQRILAHCRPGDSIQLIPEPDNPHDRFAIAVVHRLGMIGYIPRDGRGDLLDQIDRGRVISCSIFKIIGGEPDKPSRGILLEVTVKVGRS